MLLFRLARAVQHYWDYARKQVEKILLRFSEKRFPALITKKLHKSRQLAGERTVSIRVYTNREPMAKTRKWEVDVRVIKPKKLCKKLPRHCLVSRLAGGIKIIGFRTLWYLL